MSLVGTITSPSSASGSASAASSAPVSHTLTSNAGQTLGGGTSGTALASAVKAAAAAIAVSKVPAPAAVVPSKASASVTSTDDSQTGHRASPATSSPLDTSLAAPATATAPALTLAPAVTAAPRSGEATTFFDDMINAPQPPANILTLSPTTSLPDLYHDFFDNHPELYDSDQSSDPEMDDLVDLEDYSSAAAIRARTMADMRQTAVSSM
ncbi:hypothetical protein BGZ68_000387 [Mortierella alpina]|nr:hypothetical protein BGZ68_000387 [Mortierella alpina]